MRAKVKKAHPSDDPQSINETAWYYENERTIDVIAECRTEREGYHRTFQVRIPARKLLASLKRMGLIGKSRHD